MKKEKLRETRPRHSTETRQQAQVAGASGNQVFFASQLLQAAPPLQIAALPLGARGKLDPYSHRVTLMTKAAAPNSAREKMPFEVTPLVPYLMRNVESSAEQPGDSNAAVALNQQN